MKRFYTIAIIIVVTFTSYSQSLGYQDLAILFSQNDENGSARFSAMAGAFGAIGGDISSININPAGIAIYRNSVALGTFNSREANINSSYYGTSTNTQEQFFNLSHAGAVLVFDNENHTDWNKFTLGFNYRITKDFKENYLTQGNSGVATFTQFPLDANDTPIDYLVADKQLFNNSYNGDISEINVAFSGVHQNKLYIGIGFNTYDLNFSQKATLTELNSDTNGNTLDAYLYQQNVTTGTGFSLSAGFIYKIHPSFRFGLSYQTPTWFTEMIEETNIINNEGYFGDTVIEVSENPTAFDNVARNGFLSQSLIYRLKTPSKLTASAAFIFGKNGLISIDYTNKNYQNIKLSNEDFSKENQFFQNDLKNTYTIRVGTEWRLDRFSIRGGYKFEQDPSRMAIDSDNLRGYSFGGGYNFGNIKIDFSYSNANRTSFYNFYSGFNSVNPADLQTDTKTITTTVTFNL